MSRSAVSVAHIVIRWAARLAGVFVIGLVLLIAVGETVRNGHLPPAKLLLHPLSLGMLAAMAGMVVGWWREGLGGTIVVLAGIGMYAYHLLASHRWLGGAFPLFLVPGILLLIGYWLSRRSSCPTSVLHLGDSK